MNRSAAPKVLVIDDDADLRELLRLHLANAGYDVLLAEDAVVGGYMVFDSRPDLIIADVLMPYLDGYEFVRALKADAGTRDIPVVFLTQHAEAPARAKELGAVAALGKPVFADRLLEVVALYTHSAA